MKLRFLNSKAFEAICELRLLYRAEGLGKKLMRPKGLFCANVLSIPRYTINRVAELEKGTGRRKGKILVSSLVAKYCCSVRQIGKGGGIIVYYEWQKENMKFGCWAKKFSKELEATGLGFICHNLCGRNEKEICKIK
jgi:hypothetical protein